MTTAFETLYDLAIDIRTNPIHRAITGHHTPDRDLAKNQLQRSILTLVMPGENINSRWQRLRIFCKNLVNRAHSPVSSQDVTELLSEVERLYSDDHDRVSNVVAVAHQSLTTERSVIFKDAVEKLTSSALISEFGGVSYFDWVDQRWAYWVNKSMGDASLDELINDVHLLSDHKVTKIPGMGLALAANFLADMGLLVFGKPDLHVTPVMNLLTLRTGELEAFKALVSVAKIENQMLSRQPKFSWLNGHGGVTTRYLDRLIYLIASDNFNLDGRRDKQNAPKRRALIRSTFIHQHLISAHYSG